MERYGERDCVSVCVCEGGRERLYKRLSEINRKIEKKREKMWAKIE
jgi:hypothetical protein